LNSFFNIFTKDRDTENENSILIGIVLKNLSKIMTSQINIENEEFFLNFANNFYNVTECIAEVKDWRIQKEALIGISTGLDQMHRYSTSITSGGSFLNSFNIINTNSNSNSTSINLSQQNSNDDFSVKIFNFIKKFINSENYQIQIEIIRILAKDLKYCKNKEDILKYTESELFQSKSFYKRRLYFTFFETCLELFSIKYIKENGILENFFKFFEEDSSSIIICMLICIFPSIYPLINDDIELKFKFLNKVSDLKKSTKLTDKEIIISLKKFSTWEDSFRRDKDNEIYREKYLKDKQKMEEETKREKEFQNNNVLSNNEYKRDVEKRPTVKKLTIIKKKTSLTNTTLSQLMANSNFNSNSNSTAVNINSAIYASNATVSSKKLLLKDSYISNGITVCNFPAINKGGVKK
jgi:hypothetical protein